MPAPESLGERRRRLREAESIRRETARVAKTQSETKSSERKRTRGEAARQFARGVNTGVTSVPGLGRLGSTF